MSNSIKQLVNQVGTDVSGKWIAVDKADKLAELIVRECADYVQFYYKDHMCEVIAQDMKTHFGIK
jgi:hypothetical protein